MQPSQPEQAICVSTHRTVSLTMMTFTLTQLSNSCTTDMLPACMHQQKATTVPYICIMRTSPQHIAAEWRTNNIVHPGSLSNHCRSLASLISHNSHRPLSERNTCLSLAGTTAPANPLRWDKLICQHPPKRATEKLSGSADLPNTGLEPRTSSRCKDSRQTSMHLHR